MKTVIEIAREAGFTINSPEWVPAQTGQLERFAALVREEDAKVCEELGFEPEAEARCAAAIRSRCSPTSKE